EREQPSLARRQPLARCRSLALRAMPIAAAVVGDRGVGAVFAAGDVPAEGCRAAVLDGAHHLELTEADVTAVGMTPCGTMVAEDVRDLHSWTGHERLRATRAARFSWLAVASTDPKGSRPCGWYRWRHAHR